MSGAPHRGEVRISLFGRTDVGQIREHNEDNFLIADLTRRSRSLMEADRNQTVGERGTVMGVCDGMGGAAAGEVASQLAVDIIYEKLSQGDPPEAEDELARRLVRAVEEAGIRIFTEARADRSRRGMGTTSTITALLGPRLFLAQVGDSRAYLLRGGVLTQVTRDQSLVTQLIEAGQLTEEEAETFEHNNIILQALGTAETVQVDLTYVDLRQNDLLMICSDGLSGMIRSHEIREVLLANPEPIDACKVLTERANLAGGHDNITVIVARFDGDGVPPLGLHDEPARYQKYALPELEQAEARAAEPAPPSEPAPVEESEEAQRESRRLRVGHTMVGITAPAAQATQPAQAAASLPRPSSFPPPAPYQADDDPVELPTSGLPPSVVGLLMLSALLLVAVTGYWVLAKH